MHLIFEMKLQYIYLDDSQSQSASTSVSYTVPTLSAEHARLLRQPAFDLYLERPVERSGRRGESWHCIRI